jgi:predicted nucleic acid-binding protein
MRPSGPQRNILRRADTEAILLARELRAVLLTDDAEAREVAEALSVKVVGTIAVLIRARLEGKIDRLQPVLDQLRTETNFRMSEAVYTQALRAVAELA